MATTQTSASTLNIPMADTEPGTVMLRSADAPLRPTPEAVIAATLLPAMLAGTDLEVNEPIDPSFASNVSTIQDIYETWYDDAQRIAVHAPEGQPCTSPSTGQTATFFTGGVDSFYTLLKNKERIDTLVYVHGFDVKLDDAPLRQQVSDMLHEVGTQFDKEVIQVETNLRAFSGGRVSWGRYHGAALATVALSMQQLFDVVLVPSPFPWDALQPWGSSPVLDPLWSTRKLELVHDGCEANRMDKCRYISQSDVALQSLRVCWQNRGGAYNCGKCEKCMRTMVQLLALNALDRCSTFAHPLDPSRIAKNDVIRGKKYHYRDPLAALQRSNKAPEITAAILKALQPPPLHRRTMQAAYDRYQSIRHWAGNLLRSWGFR